jgi:hypothetical protein
VQAGTPVANIVAMIDALHEFNGRPRGSEPHAHYGDKAPGPDGCQ